MIKKTVNRYAFFIFSFTATLIIALLNKDIGFRAFEIARSSFLQMLSVLPPIMLLLSLMDLWVPRETMMKYMGKGSGFMGIALSILLGSLAAGPMYAAFPATAVLLRKRVKLGNVIIFMDAWCVTKISTLMFEITALGYEFTLIRLLINMPGIIIMGYMTEWLLSLDEVDRIYTNSETMD